MAAALASTRSGPTFDPAAVEAELSERCRLLVERARALGADEAEACGSSWRSISVRFEKGDLKLAQVDVGSTVGLRVFRGGRLGFSATNQAGRAALEDCARDAVGLASLAPPDAHNVLPLARDLPRSPIRIDPAILELPIERAVGFGRDLVARAKSADARLSIDSAAVDVTGAARAIVTSRGIDARESDAQVSLSIVGMAIDGADVGGFHYTGDQIRRLAEVEPSAARAADELAGVAVGNLGARPAESYTGPVLFSPDAFLEVFVAPIVSASSAIAVQRGRSALASRRGEPIAAKCLSIFDDATDAELSGAAGFDREGQPCGRFAIVEGGVLRGFLYNSYAAAVEGRVSTGHARGSPRGVPGLGAHAIAVAPGDEGTREALARRLGRGLFVQRFSGTVDPASGDFSGVAKSARWIEGGVSAFPVRETMIGGNAFALLGKIAALSSASERCMGEARAPFGLVDGVAVTAG